MTNEYGDNPAPRTWGEEQPMDDPMPPVAEPPWLTAMVDQRLTEFDQTDLAVMAIANIMMTSLTEPDADTKEAVDRWERTCDRCGRYVPPDSNLFFVGSVSREYRGMQVIMSLGLCSNCKP